MERTATAARHAFAWGRLHAVSHLPVAVAHLCSLATEVTGMIRISEHRCKNALHGYSLNCFVMTESLPGNDHRDYFLLLHEILSRGRRPLVDVYEEPKAANDVRTGT